jgi:clan AA aspartic protease
MISGTVNGNLEAIIEVDVGGLGSQRTQVDVIIDTGFSGFLTLPPVIITQLKLPWLGREEGILADGRIDLFDVYCASVTWDGQERPIEVQAVNAQPLAGMALMQGHSLRMDVATGGTVTIAALP